MTTKKLLENLILALRLYTEDLEQDLKLLSSAIDDIEELISDLKEDEE